MMFAVHQLIWRLNRLTRSLVSCLVLLYAFRRALRLPWEYRPEVQRPQVYDT
jgi:hypothetical protein